MKTQAEAQELADKVKGTVIANDKVSLFVCYAWPLNVTAFGDERWVVRVECDLQPTTLTQWEVE